MPVRATRARKKGQSKLTVEDAMKYTAGMVGIGIGIAAINKMIPNSTWSNIAQKKSKPIEIEVNL